VNPLTWSTAYPDAVPTSRKPDESGTAIEPAQPVALDPPMVPFAIGGIAIWAVVGLALLPFRDTLEAHGHGNWLAICLAGFLWGFPGLAVMIHHDANRRRRKK
jgi:Protein of unknown function (DUF2530)